MTRSARRTLRAHAAGRATPCIPAWRHGDECTRRNLGVPAPKLGGGPAAAEE
jgi:hypothetical protein